MISVGRELMLRRGVFLRVAVGALVFRIGPFDISGQAPSAAIPNVSAMGGGDPTVSCMVPTSPKSVAARAKLWVPGTPSGKVRATTR